MANGRQLFGHRVDGHRTRDFLRRHGGHPDQAVGIELAELLTGDGRGVRVLRLRTGEIDVELLVDRALDVLRATVRGIPVGWLSPAGVRHPAYAEHLGMGPLRTFTGGLLTTAGLDHAMGPEGRPDPFGHPGITEHEYGLHGRVATLPATLTRVETDWDRDVPALVVHGQIRQTSPFGERLVLHRRIEADLGGRQLRIVDEVENEGDTPTPLAVLYHVNVGWPVLSPTARLLADTNGIRRPTPPDETTQVDNWSAPLHPSAGATETVYEHDVRPNAAGWASAAVVNDNIGDGRAAGLRVSWDTTALPHLMQWRMPAERMYVTAWEPAMVGIDGPAAAAAAGALRHLAPDETAVLGIELDLLTGPDLIG